MYARNSQSKSRDIKIIMLLKKEKFMIQGIKTSCQILECFEMEEVTSTGPENIIITRRVWTKALVLVS